MNETPDAQPDDWSSEELDRAYRQALDAMQAVEEEFGPADQPVETETGDEDSGIREGTLTESSSAMPAAGSPGDLSYGTWDVPVGESRVTPRQIIEAALFVGGAPLTARKLCSLLRDDFDSQFVEQTLDDLNDQYAAEHRPYEIRLGEGGYRLVLRAEFEPVRNRVFGLGPKEIKLSQEALEVLALVAYQQPLSREQIEQSGKRNAGSVLRQLLRRELIAIERHERPRREVQYRTTERFLELFGLAHLDELPRAEELSLK